MIWGKSKLPMDDILGGGRRDLGERITTWAGKGNGLMGWADGLG